MTAHLHNPVLAKRFLSLLMIVIMTSITFSNKKEKIIFIHGFMGWGEHEMGGYHYWGGKVNLIDYLQSQGFDVDAVSVGPISSNWDRAVEAYTQIKGGQVDYGFVHSSKYKLNQKPKGKSYHGIHPVWSASNPIHIIAHSQGGQTARMLEYLLKNKFDGEESDLLGTEMVGWVKSITTISSPHNGTVLADEISKNLPFLQKITPFFGILDDSWFENYYDFDLEQWSLQKKEGESTSDFFNRLSNADIKTSKNFCAWDLSIKGSKEFNDIYSTDPDVYYFSYLTYSSSIFSNGGHVPDNNMSPVLWIPSLIIGQSNKVDDAWYMNDGIVNTVSMKYPTNSSGENEPNKIYNEDNIEKGTWQVMEPINMDHQLILGHRITSTNNEEIQSIYSNICKRIYNLN